MIDGSGIRRRTVVFDLQFFAGDWTDLDSYFGSSDSSGQEVVYYRREPVWAMGYLGFILDDSQMNAATAGELIR